ncbi:MAG: T9SS type A sorting domain-containing protein [Bacteroidetes bacterium]|nr:MAG: T9SS type A sorting domain-containing protein [Bacteroidota bacterium]
MKFQKAIRRLLLCCFTFVLLFANSLFAQNDLPTPDQNIQVIKSGSLIIPMDNTLQATPGYFNLMAYGLVNQLLQNNIPVKWAIKAGKIKDGIDFSATSKRIRPSVGVTTSYDFRCGPFIIDSVYANAAKTLASSFGGNVTMYQTVGDCSVDIRYTLNFKPRIAICSNGGNQNIHLNALTAAGMNNASWVSVIPASQVVPICGYTIVSEPHWDTSGDTAHTRPVYRYLKNGGNFFAQCKGVRTYENDDTVHTTNGISIQSGSTLSYMNADMPIMQFDGVLTIPGGSLQFWDRTGGSFRSTTYAGIRTGSAPYYQYLNGAKIVSNSVAGGNMFYLGGHDYNNTTSNSEINGRRIYLNAVLIPPNPLAWCSTLPVQLLYFEAIPEGSKVLLRWATATESNNDHFVIERSRDGIDFSLIQSVKGGGTTSKVSYYLTEDMLPFDGYSYYRLTQVDYDGQSEIFDPVKVNFKSKKSKFSIYPNPATEGINISLVGSKIKKYTLELSDLCSKSVVAKEEIISDQGDNYFWKFPGKLHAGVYSLKLSDGITEEFFKLVIGNDSSE